MQRRLAALWRDDRGNVLAIGAATLPLLLGAAAFAIDSIQLTVWKRELQRAADSAAIAGAYAVAQTDDVNSAVRSSLVDNLHPQLTRPAAVAIGRSLGFERTVRVDLNSTLELRLMRIFTGSGTDITVSATAALADDQGRFCVVSLYNGGATGIEFSGTGTATLNCAIHTNSEARRAVNFNGGTRLVAPIVSASGGIESTASNFVPPTLLEPNAVPQEDPLAHLPDPPPQFCSAPLTVRAQTTQVLTPGCYSELNLQGVATLLPGVYYVNGGDVSFGAQAVVLGAGVTIVMTGPNGQAGDLQWAGGASVNLSSSGTGPYPGVLFFRDRRADNKQMKIVGNTTTRLTGAMYFPTSDIAVGGGADMNVRCLQLIGQRMSFNGNVNIANECPTESGASAFRQVRVRIVR